MERQPAGGELDEMVEALAALSRVLVGLTASTLANVDVDLTLPQHRALVILAAKGPLRTIDLAAALRVHPSTATRSCNRLVRKGLVARRQGTADRRVSWLGLTRSGKDLVGAVVRRREAEIRRLVLAAGVSGGAPAMDFFRAVLSASEEPSEQQWWDRWEKSTSAGRRDR